MRPKQQKKELLQGDLLQTKDNCVIPVHPTLSAFPSYSGHNYKFLNTLLIYLFNLLSSCSPLTFSILKQPRFSSSLISESSATLFPSSRISVLSYQCIRVAWILCWNGFPGSAPSEVVIQEVCVGLSSQVMLIWLVWGPHAENHWSGVIFLNSCILSPSDLRSNICLLKEAFASCPIGLIPSDL